MPSREERARIAAETVAIMQSGCYRTGSGISASISAPLQAAVSQTRLLTPRDLDSLREQFSKVPIQKVAETSFSVRNETTFAAAKRLVDQFGPERVTALNFASARNPGGGFLTGAQAQEESLARGSALHACLLTQPEYYEANRQHRSALYTDHMIYSPRVPVFRNDDDGLLSQPWEVSILTAPAPNASAITRNEPHAVPQLKSVFRRRIENVLATAVAFEQRAVVLGAWGCGVFGNSPDMVARLYREFLCGDGVYSRAFEVVAFAILDRGSEIIGPFQKAFH